MTKDKRRKVKLALAGKGISLAEIGRRCDPPVGRAYVCLILSGARTGYRVRPVIAAHLGWDPWTQQSTTSAA
jgi:hypothetical protein